MKFHPNRIDRKNYESILNAPNEKLRFQLRLNIRESVMNKLEVSVVELDERLEQQSTAVLALASLASLVASNAYALNEDTCGNLQNMPCETTSCGLFSW